MHDKVLFYLQKIVVSFVRCPKQGGLATAWRSVDAEIRLRNCADTQKQHLHPLSVLILPVLYGASARERAAGGDTVLCIYEWSNEGCDARVWGNT